MNPMFVIVAGLVLLTAAGALVAVPLGVAVAGLSCVAVGVFLDLATPDDDHDGAKRP